MKILNQKLLSISLAAFLSVAAQAARAGGVGDGGGAGVCRGSSAACQTLPQLGAGAGHALEVVTKEVRDQARSIIKSLPLSDPEKEALVELVLRDARVFRFSADPGQHEAEILRIRQDYRQALGQLPAGFTVFAFSATQGSPECSDLKSQGRTTMLPSFLRLDPQGKALKLIHESIYSCRPRNQLGKILELDQLIFNSIASNSGEQNAARIRSLLQELNVLKTLAQLKATFASAQAPTNLEPLIGVSQAKCMTDNVRGGGEKMELANLLFGYFDTLTMGKQADGVMEEESSLEIPPKHILDDYRIADDRSGEQAPKWLELKYAFDQKTTSSMFTPRRMQQAGLMDNAYHTKITQYYQYPTSIRVVTDFYLRNVGGAWISKTVMAYPGYAPFEYYCHDFKKIVTAAEIPTDFRKP